VTVALAELLERPVVDVARALVGWSLEHGECRGVIVETEAYHDSEPACHAFVGLTPRTRPLFGPPGVAYVYRSYGIHALFNVVTEAVGVGSAVLIRALQPSAGIDLMRERRGRERTRELCSGPGRLTQALGIGLGHNGSSLVDGPIRLGPPTGELPRIVAAERVGITKAVDLQWRFCAVGSEFVSRPAPRPARIA
jgi:DNA-3-methyladenine glycosylase